MKLYIQCILNASGIRILLLILGVFLFGSLKAQESNPTLRIIQKILLQLEEARRISDTIGHEIVFLKLIKLPVDDASERIAKSDGILKELDTLYHAKDPWIELNYILHCLQNYPLGKEEKAFLLALLKKGQEDLSNRKDLEPEIRIYYSLYMRFDYADWRKKNGYYQEAIDSMELVKNHLLHLSGEETWHPHTKNFLLRCYNILGGIYADLGMYPLAISYNDLYLELIKNDLNPWGKALALGRKGDYFLKMGDTTQSLPILEETVRICATEYPELLTAKAQLEDDYDSNYRNYTSRLKSAYRNLASVYLAKGKLQKADEMLLVVEEIPILHSEDAVRGALSRAEFLSKTNNISGAIAMMNDGLSEALYSQGQSFSIGKESNLRLVMLAGLQLSKLQQQAGKFQAARTTLDKLENELQKLGNDIRIEVIQTNVEQVRLDLEIYKHKPQDVDLNGTLKRVIYTQSLILEYQAAATDGPSKLELNRSGRELFGLGLALAAVMPVGLIQDELAVQHAEAGRAVLLDQALRFQRTEQFQDIPDSLQQVLLQLSALIQGYELNQSLGQPLSQKELSHLTTLREDKRRLTLRLKKDFPSNYTQSMVRQLPGMKDLRKQLPGGTGILSLALHDTLIYAHLITKKGSAFRRIPVPPDFRTSIHRFLSVVKSSRQEKWSSAEGQRFTLLARMYYRLLFEPFEKQLPQRLLIVPDGPLAFIPFDCLLTADPPQNAQWNNLPYQIHKRAISVHFSMGAWLAEEQKTLLEFKYPWAGFAPDFPIPIASRSDEISSRDILIKLLYNTQEVERVGALLEGKIFLGQNASLDAFRRVAGQSAILHLSTHAKANDQRGDHCFIAFSNSIFNDPSDPGDTLRAAEIYRLEIPAELLILSACETGIGEVKDGEGMIGLHHAFTHAGVRSILSTLWTVDDRSMADLMVYFASILAKGHTKDVALQNAKLQFLENHPKQAHPFYWSAPTIQGSLQPLYSSGYLWYWMGGMLIVGGLFFGHRYQKSRRA